MTTSVVVESSNAPSRLLNVRLNDAVRNDVPNLNTNVFKSSEVVGVVVGIV